MMVCDVSCDRACAVCIDISARGFTIISGIRYFPRGGRSEGKVHVWRAEVFEEPCELESKSAWEN